MAIDLSTRYLGLDLSSPLMPGASALVDDPDTVRRLEDAGASAIVLYSLFEEQIRETSLRRSQPPGGSTRAVTFASVPGAIGPDAYLELVHRTKLAVAVPVIASLNGRTVGDWIEHARAIEQAGADALELNLYFVATDVAEPGAAIEERCVEIVRAARAAVTIPLAVKLSPFYTSVANLAHRFDGLGVDGLVLFNRFFQPDIDVDKLDYVARLDPSDPTELKVRLRWIALLFGRVRASLALSGGVHSPIDVVKGLMAGADALQVVSALLVHGPAFMRTLRDGLVGWMEEHGHASLADLRGRLSLGRAPNPGALERASYIEALRAR